MFSGGSGCGGCGGNGEWMEASLTLGGMLVTSMICCINAKSQILY